MNFMYSKPPTSPTRLPIRLPKITTYSVVVTAGGSSFDMITLGNGTGDAVSAIGSHDTITLGDVRGTTTTTTDPSIDYRQFLGRVAAIIDSSAPARDELQQVLTAAGFLNP